MYWPNGVPRVYAVNGPNIAYVPSDDDRDMQNSVSTHNPSSSDGNENTNGDRAQHESQDTQPNESRTVPSPETGKSGWGEEAIKGICVSRSGLMFATISESSIALWQTRVC
jgi:hypothetical protein